MNNFATIKHIQTFKKVNYYSIVFEDEEDSLFEDFLNKCAEIPELLDEVGVILEWIKKLGDEIGAKLRYFRHEGATSDAKALPPPTRFLAGDTTNLRLYCMVISETVVLLYSGAIKTTQKAQDCPNVSSHFRLANKITAIINKCFLEKEIYWNEEDTDIIYSNDFEFEV